MEVNKNYNFDEFLGLLLLYSAHVDIDYGEKEKAFIHDIVSQKAYDTVKEDFKNMSDYEVLQTILSYKDKYFANEEAREKLLEKIEMLFYVDDEYHPMEKELRHFLEKLMD